MISLYMHKRNRRSKRSSSRMRGIAMCRNVAVMLLLCMTLLLSPIVKVEAIFDGFEVNGGIAGLDYVYSPHGPLVIMTSASIIVSNEKSGVTTDTIKVKSGVIANVTLDGVNIDVGNIGNACAFDITGASLNLTLEQGSVNMLKSGSGRAGIYTSSDSIINITGEGRLDVCGGSNAPGIGGASGGSIKIFEGNIKAYGGVKASGIGGGFGEPGIDVLIAGGNLLARGANGCYGIGGGIEGREGITIIRGGSVNATVQGRPQRMRYGENVYLTTIVLMDENTVIGRDCNITALELSPQLKPFYNMHGVSTNSAGEIYVWLPENTKVSKVKSNANKQFKGSVITSKDGEAKGVFLKSNYSGNTKILPYKSPIIVGESVHLVAAMSPDIAEEATWRSLNTDVVVVDKDGVAKGIDSGNASIVLFVNDIGVLRICDISVLNPEKVIKLNHSRLNLGLGGSRSLKVLSRKDSRCDMPVMWSSNNTDIVTVSDGVVKAVGCGTATVSAISLSGDCAVCYVTVDSPTPIMMFDMSIDGWE